MNAELVHRRRILNADELATLVAPRARYEQTFDTFGAHFFTIDGILQGTKVTGALFAGECMLIFAIGVGRAQELANQGLRSTIEFLHKEFETRPLRDDLGPIGQGTDEEVAGRRARTTPGGELRTLPKVKALIAHIMGGKPWSW